VETRKGRGRGQGRARDRCARRRSGGIDPSAFTTSSRRRRCFPIRESATTARTRGAGPTEARGRTRGGRGRRREPRGRARGGARGGDVRGDVGWTFARSRGRERTFEGRFHLPDERGGGCAAGARGGRDRGNQPRVLPAAELQAHARDGRHRARREKSGDVGGRARRVLREFAPKPEQRQHAWSGEVSEKIINDVPFGLLNFSG